MLESVQSFRLEDQRNRRSYLHKPENITLGTSGNITDG